MINKSAIKIGKKGSIVLEDDQKYLIKPNQIKAKDTTGAGDMYAAGFLSGLAKGLSSKESGEIGSFLAEEIIQKFGAQFTLERIVDLKSKIFDA